MFSTYIPHYTKLIDRKPHIEMQLNKIGVDNAKFITSFDGDSLTSEDMKSYVTNLDYFNQAVKPSIKKLGINKIEQRALKNSEISLVLKHFQAIYMFIKSENKYALILEDDVYFIYDHTNIKQVIYAAPDSFDVLFLGGPLQRDFFNIKDIYGDYLLVDHPSTNTTSSIIYSKEAAIKLYKSYKMRGFCLPLDWQLNYFFQLLDMKVYHIYPKLCTQLSGNEFRSSIQ